MPIFYTDSGSFRDLTISGSTIMSASSGIPLQIIGSGSTLFSISGSSGELFKIVDSGSSTSLFSVSSGSTTILDINSSKTVSISGSLVVTGSITGTTNTATNLSITDDTTTNATNYIVFVNSNTGTPAPRVDSSTLTYNPSTDTITSTNFAGTATNASNVAVSATNANSTYYPHFGNLTSGNDNVEVDTNLTYNPSTNTLTVGSLTAQNNLIVSGNVTIGDATTDSIIMNAATMSLGSGTGVLNIDSNTLYVNGNNNTVGIGTTSSIDVIAGTGSLRIVAGATTFGFSNGNANQGFMSVSSGSMIGLVGHTNATDGIVFGAYSNHAMALRTNNNNRLTISNSGVVTIGSQLNANGGIVVTGNVTASGDIAAQTDLKSNYSAGDEGGQIFLNKPVTNTSINTGVNIDVYQNKLRIFESGGTNRGGYWDLTALSASVGSNLASGGGGGTTSPSGSNGYVQYNSSSAFGAEAQFTYDYQGGATSVLNVPGILINRGIRLISQTTVDSGNTPYSAQRTELVFLCDTSTVAVDVDLVSGNISQDGQIVIIKDIGFNASVNNITFGGASIDNGALTFMDKNGQTLILMYIASLSYWIAIAQYG